MKLGNPWSYSHSIDLALKIGLPMFGGHMSRTSWSATQDQAQMVAHPILPKPFLNELDLTKDILVLWSYADLSVGEQFVLNNASKIWGNEHYLLYSISVDDLKAAHTRYRSAILDNNEASINGSSFFDSREFFKTGQMM